MPKVFFGRFSLLVLTASMVSAGVNPSEAQAQDRRIQDVMRCQMVEQRFILGRDLGMKTGFNIGGARELPAEVRQRLINSALQAIDQVFNWKVVEQDYVSMYRENYSPEQLDYILQLCQQPAYRQLMMVELQMIEDALAIGESYSPQVQEATLKAFQDVLR
tara:strand:- start:577 stop:1059 length:483 start_codon:yes stop_codon:yes gene_type:complete